MDRKAQRRRMLCSEILNVRLQGREGRDRELKANLEEIWSSGAILWTDVRLRGYTSLWFTGGGFQFRGQVVAQKLLKGLGYFIEMRFQPGCTWSERKYRPKHLFNPLGLLANRIFESTLCGPQAALARTAAAASVKSAFGS